MDGHARHAQINQMDRLLKQKRQLARPVIRIGIAGPDAEGIRSADRHIGQSMRLVPGRRLRDGRASAFSTGAQEKSAERESQHRQARRERMSWKVKQASNHRTSLPRLPSLVLIFPGQLSHKEVKLSDDLNGPLLQQLYLTRQAQEIEALFFCQAYGYDVQRHLLNYSTGRLFPSLQKERQRFHATLLCACIDKALENAQENLAVFALIGPVA